MTFKVPLKTRTDFEKLSSGTFIARIYQVIDLGVQEIEFKGEKKLQRQVLIGYEFTDELMVDGRPFVLSKKYNLSFDKKANLRKDIEAITGQSLETEKQQEEFELDSLINRICTVGVIHKTSSKGGVFVNIGSVSGAPKGVSLPPLHNKPIVYTLSEHDEAVFNEIPKWIREKINRSGHMLGNSNTEHDPLMDV